MIPRFAVILTHNRPALLQLAVDAIEPQVNKVYIIDNASDPRVERTDFASPKVAVIHISTQPPNLSSFWNAALEFADAATVMSATFKYPEWDVAFLCDDVVVPEGWFEAISPVMRRFDAAAGSTHQYSPVPVPIIKKAPDGDIFNRMCGWAFIVAGEKGLRADEDLAWWWCDTHMDFQARKNGGMVVCPGPVAKNIHPNDFTYSVPGLADQAGRDGETFAAKWGRPW